MSTRESQLPDDEARNWNRFCNTDLLIEREPGNRCIWGRRGYSLCCYVMNFRVRTVLALFALGACLHLVINGCSPTSFFSFEAEYEEPLSPEKIEQDIFGNTLTPPVSRNDTIPTTYILNQDSTGDSDNSSTDAVYWSNNSSNFTPNNSSYVMLPQPDSLALCPTHPPGLVGPIRVWLDEPEMATIEKLYSYLEVGGHGQPATCKSRHRVAIIIPYRDRLAHLKVFLHNMHSLLTKQQLDYAIFLVEPITNQTFNRAKLMNVGFVEALKMYPWDCFIFHDVDLMPEDDRNLYSCPQQPRHMSVAVDKFDYVLPYGSIFGGISALTKAHMEKLNGFSNDYWGWGGEDDDMSSRVAYAGYSISRYPKAIARYKMIKHVHETKNPVNKCRHKLMKHTRKRYHRDGLSNLKYSIQNITRFKAYTHIITDMFEKDSRTQLAKDGFRGC